MPASCGKHDHNWGNYSCQKPEGVGPPYNVEKQGHHHEAPHQQRYHDCGEVDTKFPEGCFHVLGTRNGLRTKTCHAYWSCPVKNMWCYSCRYERYFYTNKSLRY